MSDWSPEYNTDYAELVRNSHYIIVLISSFHFLGKWNLPGIHHWHSQTCIHCLLYIRTPLRYFTVLREESSPMSCFSADDDVDELRPLHGPRISEPARFPQTSIAKSSTEAPETSGADGEEN